MNWQIPSILSVALLLAGAGFLLAHVERSRGAKALRRSEEKYRLLVENALEGICVCQGDRVCFANPPFVAMTGYTLEELLSQSLLVIVHPGDHPKILDAYTRRMRGESAPARYEFRGLTKTGEVRHLLMSSVRIEWEGQPAALDLVSDLSELKRTEAERDRLEGELLQAQKMEAVGTLASGIAHDFNNILQAISGNVQLLRRRNETGDVLRGRLGQIDEAVDRAAGLVRQLLTFARKERPEPRSVDLNRHVACAVALLERTLPKMIRIETLLAEDLPAVWGDSSQLEQIVLNLGANARDAMPQGGCLRIETCLAATEVGQGDGCEDAPPGVVLSVSDTGVGMDASTMRRMFEPFFTTKGVGEGTGLGLSIVYALVSAHQGRIDTRSSPGGGTCFTVCLPAGPEGQVEAAVPAAAAVETLGGSETVLVVDDEATLCGLAREALEERGYRVLTASSGEETLRLYEGNPGGVGVVILDLGMPGMGGQECLERLLALDPKAKVIVATGYATGEKAQGVMARGARAFVAKPYRTADLAARVREVLDG